MAVLEMPVNNGNPFADILGDGLAPAGTYVATVLDVKDEFGVTRQKYQSMEMETVDLTCFLFGFRDAAGQPHRVASKRMRISGNEKSSLFAFLKGLLGRAPQYGWDYCTVKGQKCLLTVEHIQRRDGVGVFAAIAALSPVPSSFAQNGATAGHGGMGMGRAEGGNLKAEATAQSRPPVAEGGASGGRALPVAVSVDADDPIPF